MNPAKPVQAANVPTPTERPRRQIPHEEIALLAERIWHERNRPAGQDEAIWLEAESRLQAEAKPVAGTETRPYMDQPVKTPKPQTKSRDPAEAPAPSRTTPPSRSKPGAGKLRSQ